MIGYQTAFIKIFGSSIQDCHTYNNEILVDFCLPVVKVDAAIRLSQCKA